MSLLKKTLQSFSSKWKTPKGARRTGYNKYTSSDGGYQAFTTGQDYQKKKVFFLKRWKQRFFGSKSVPAETGYASRRVDEPRVGLALIKLFSIVFLVGSLGFVSKGIFSDMLHGLNYFHIQNIEIRGCKVTTQQEIRDSGGFNYGVSLFAIDTEKSVADLEEHAWIKSVVIKRKWPNRLLVNITEYRPEAIIAQASSAGDSLHYINGKGVCFSQVQPGEDVDYPVITGLDGLITKAERDDALGDALYFLRLAKMNNPNLPAQLVSEINMDEEEGMVIYLVEHPFPIYFGRNDVNKKYKQLRRVLEMLYKKQKNQMKISQVMYIRMDYLTNKVLVAQSGSG